MPSASGVHRRPIRGRDAVWASKAEPRIAELLPALVIKKPSLLVVGERLPRELEAVVDAIRKSKKLPDFQGIELNARSEAEVLRIAAVSLHWL